ncbi:cobalamin biosynthesis protein [Frigidibacter sp. RF13]|uniref:cobalamin biosynthesis protein n=1 Tax=Frigidibacter sp. RF13 TaxID=2997340 RepID=UPI0022700137|nr:cobalamin biosynthesis protein [Frigidibacter sp. RF13]MCY1128357.1 cobalamin biosynthesis protein [Frigidibacter sp. RF13]
MRVAGFGFRGAATVASLQDALARAGGGVTALATADRKASAPVAGAFARALGLPLVAVPRDLLARAVVLTHSAKVAERFGTGSVAEAAALVACGPGARLIGPRVVSGDGLATVAIAERDGA